ncbi:SDR family oxidoreductase [Saccharopolyspora sp. HNM0986]|uniref:SDR family NAD(P)-dependent oxidoreductase n=1 Tax=Saccharopolyspora galaxeae TaxID=2781241 RepID=UPI00190DCC95|nr:SDR family oxidoreductase [Saccharopolyspora sp. HNM0986]MBK0869281.1 SDR family oxidoreductase [Saccharopolyspora sp. HNM0986]
MTQISEPARALVVGGSTGIGRAIAGAWAETGAEVIVASRSRPDDAALGWLQIDLSDPAGTRRALAEVVRQGPLHAACYSAVHYGDKRAPLRDVAESEWLHQLEVNLNGLWRTVAAVSAALREAAPGLFVGVSSEVVYNAGPGRPGYAATKSAAASLLDSLAQEESAEALRVVQVLPSGMVDTPGIRRRRPADFDYGEYMRPACFAPLAAELLRTRGTEQHGDHLVVQPDGSWRSVHAGLPESQSREPAT